MLTRIARTFQKEYHLGLKQGTKATFGNVLWALGNDSKKPSKFRSPALPKDGYTIPIRERYPKQLWDFLEKLNEKVNGEVHFDIFPQVNGKIKLILPNDDGLYNPEMFEKALRIVNIIEPEEEIIFQRDH